jgi:hypothetical protein
MQEARRRARRSNPGRSLGDHYRRPGGVAGSGSPSKPSATACDPPSPKSRGRLNEWPREAYRLREYHRLGPGRHEMRPIPGENRLFTTWKAACDAAEAMKGHIVTQSILIDADGQLVFPVEGRQMRTEGRWIAAVNFRYRHRGVGGAPRSPNGQENTGGKVPQKSSKPLGAPRSPVVQENTGPARGRADRSGRGHMRLSRKVVDRLAEIRQESPDFGRRSPATGQFPLSGASENL